MRAVIAALLAFATAAHPQSETQSYGEPPIPRVVAYVGQALQNGDLASASALVTQFRRLNGDTPEALDALSWLARGELAAGRFEDALRDAREIKRSAQASLATRKLDSEPYLPIALGAAYEVETKALVQQHKRSEAIQLIRSALRMWRGTSIVERLQKNLNELTLVGSPLPALEENEWIGSKPTPLLALRGKVVLLFFWAHWCSDCKADAPVITALAREFASQGLLVVAPTRRYGYTAQEEHAAPAQEMPFIQAVYARYYSAIPNAGVPVSAPNFERFGVSTTPTIVLVDRKGIVRLYHPGYMDEAALKGVIQPLLAG